MYALVLYFLIVIVVALVVEGSESRCCSAGDNVDCLICSAKRVRIRQVGDCEG